MDSYLAKGIKNISSNLVAAQLLKSRFEGVPERLYNEFGKSLSSVDMKGKSKSDKQNQIQKVGEILSEYLNLPNEKIKDFEREKQQLLDNLEFEAEAYKGLDEQEKIEAVTEDKQQFSTELTESELTWVNENYFMPKGYQYNKNWELIKQNIMEQKTETSVVTVDAANYKFLDFSEEVIQRASISIQGEDWFSQLIAVHNKITVGQLYDKITFADDRLVMIAYEAMAKSDIFDDKSSLREWWIVKRYFDIFLSEEIEGANDLRHVVNSYIGFTFSNAQITDEETKVLVDKLKFLSTIVFDENYPQKFPQFVLDFIENQEAPESAGTEDGEVIETVKPKKQTADFSIFVDAVLSSKDLKQAFEKVSKIQGVPIETAEAFRKKYDPKENLTPIQAFEKFYNEVKKTKTTKVVEGFETEEKQLQGLIDVLQIFIETAEDGEDVSEWQKQLEQAKIELQKLK